MPRRCFPWLCPQFPAGCPFRGHRRPVSSPRYVEPGGPISGTGLSCPFHVQAYETCQRGALSADGAQASTYSTSIRRLSLRRDVQPPPRGLAANRFYQSAPASHEVGGTRTVGSLRSSGITRLRRYYGPVRHFPEEILQTLLDSLPSARIPSSCNVCREDLSLLRFPDIRGMTGDSCTEGLPRAIQGGFMLTSDLHLRQIHGQWMRQRRKKRWRLHEGGYPWLN